MENLKMSEARSSKRGYYLLACLWPLGFFMNGLMFSIPPLMDILKTDLQITYEQSGLIFSVPLLMLILFSVPSGWLGDTIGPFKAIGIGSVLVGVGSSLRAVSVDFYSLLLFISIYGLGWALVLSNVPKLLRRLFPGENLGTATGIFTTSIVAGPGFILFLTRTWVFPYTESWRQAFLFWGLFALLSSAIWWVVTRTAAFERKESRERTLRKIGLRAVLKTNILLTGVIISVINFIFYSISAWLGLFLESQGSSHQSAAFVVSLCSWAGILGNLLLPRISDYIGMRRPLVLAGSVIMGVTCLLVPYIPLVLEWLAALVLGTFIAGTYSIALILPAETLDDHDVALGTGLVLSLGYIGGLIGPWIGGFILDSGGSFTHLIYVLLASSLVMLFAAIVLQETGHRTKVLSPVSQSR
jgi:CP family cyanate transporter-like MFS transporter